MLGEALGEVLVLPVLGADEKRQVHPAAPAVGCDGGA
jgi:hypothetical protein